MYCPNCKQEYEGKFCPECGTKLIEKPDTSGVSLNLGDANAISGGLHVSDSHAVHNKAKAEEERIRKVKAEEEARRRAEEAKRRAEAEAIIVRAQAVVEEAERKRKEEQRRKEVVAWNVLQSCSSEDIEKYGISIISFDSGKKLTIYYRGYTFEFREEITKIKSHLDLISISNLIAEREGKGIFEVKDSVRKDIETYYKDNSKYLDNTFSIITYCSESDLYKLWRIRGGLHCRIVQEMQLLPLCLDSEKDLVYSLEYQNFFCDFELGGGIQEILQAGFLDGRRDSLEEMDLDVDCEPITKKLSAFEGFYYLVLGAIVQYMILHKAFEDCVLLPVFPFDVDAEIWVNGRYRDGLHLLKRNTTIPCKKTETIIDDDCSAIVISSLGKRFVLDVPKLFGYVPKSFDITLNIFVDSTFKYILTDKESKKEVSIRQEELFNYEENG